MLSTIDYIIILGFLGFSLLLGFRLGRNLKEGGSDYFLGGRRLPLWAVVISYYATGVSAVSYMALPAYVFHNDWSPFLVGPAGAVAGFLVGVFLVHIIRRLDTPTIYSYLEKRFSREVRLVVAGLGILLAIFGRSAVILVLPAIALSTVTGLNMYISILVMGLVTTVYARQGGFAAVIWTDVIQTLMMMAGVVMIIFYASAGLPDGFSGILREAEASGKLTLVRWESNLTDPTIWVVLAYFIGNIFAAASDQPLMQRVLAAKDLKSARRTVYWGSLAFLPSNPLFFFVGAAIFAFYQANPERLTEGLANDAIVIYFIAQELPPGVVGLLIVAIFSAAMSTLSSSLSAAAAIAMSDFANTLFPKRVGKEGLKLDRWTTTGAGLFATLMAIWLASIEVRSIWEQAVKLLALFGGAIPGIFALGMLTRRANSRGVIAGALVAIGFTAWLQFGTSVNAFAQGCFATLVVFVVGYGVSLILPAADDRSRGLTVWDLRD
jgi:SSS family solute:Na+ symporter